MFMDINEPLKIPITIMCQKVTIPIKSRVPRTNVRIPLPIWLKTINFFLETRSAKAPAKGATTVMGKAKVKVTSVSAKGESSVTLNISQLLVIICIFIAMKDTNEPIHTHLKSLYERASTMFENLLFVDGFWSEFDSEGIFGFLTYWAIVGH